MNPDPIRDLLDVGERVARRIGHPDASDPVADPALQGVVFSRRIAVIKFDALTRFPGDGYECRLYDAEHRLLATLYGALDLDTKNVSAFDFTVTRVTTDEPSGSREPPPPPAVP